ncbi:DNA repair protein RecO [Candidatus Roizmanbacteria bacterium CG22_combo_CG10-13_8_21_14_all_35_9]|uniref:DNA repair protein RecO n=4 Tax=Candidatus Roizmaniibacteriota TaxID=1752723 RepID=A0A2M8F4Y7_9BACT|nr:MAG: DNA repair protein RecO [Candidatus Roizmanbacteria bacterium CG23_combo_of_CG06-09_8_20_14_all_35_49]PIP62263.1 MAG: DNA repair protein RecO [Candidatus Roizmanbacteria bacterium CG22_combo_CG10-13_8_21_14_all_35_9]PIY70860.1 MAG: DNA repair protein RecO [Candidatus Roizmanbacteria bacterium CG_4_10_14_0_8_um_filter_35_28]PJC34271.1 MAG: DNA repair protein RecO [Candidatus Roizmanbacteria bacterium CG_4_9_14_0_2_um_filter_35_15]PJC82835.1 MAG: DNA repair protein RecO [Candidatus Roizma
MPRTFKTEALVLRKKNLLNRDVLVSLFSERNGKVIVIAKGVKKLTSRRSPHLQTGNLINVQLHKKNDRIYLEESNLISGFTELKKDQEKINILYQFFFVLEKLLPELQKEEAVYNLTKSFLVKLSKLEDKKSILTVYFNKLLRLLGYTKKDHDFIELRLIISELINEKLPWFSI